MPKLRNSTTDVGALTQWFGRKARNHNPLSELKLSPRQREKTSNVYRSSSKGDLRIGGNEDTLIYAAGGRTFLIKISEVTDTPEVVEALGETIPVGT